MSSLSFFLEKHDRPGNHATFLAMDSIKLHRRKLVKYGKMYHCNWGYGKLEEW
jgi:hypothetical protein